ncbi:MAG TPA: hypothetical protein VEX18_17030 [Polyangiaceae bacterium]|nr:hypothetical protein [Polyangiaceae bacterium]
MLSKILLGMLLMLLISKFKLAIFQRLRRMKPQVDRGVNIMIVLLVVLYVGQFVWLLVKE